VTVLAKSNQFVSTEGWFELTRWNTVAFNLITIDAPLWAFVSSVEFDLVGEDVFSLLLR
jgi:hypothetical protein